MLLSTSLKDCFVDHQDGLRAIVASGDFTVVVPLVGKSSRASLHSPTRLFCGSPGWSQVSQVLLLSTPLQNCFVDHQDCLRAIVASGDFTVVVPLVGKSSHASLHSPTRLFCKPPGWSQGHRGLRRLHCCCTSCR